MRDTSDGYLDGCIHQLFERQVDRTPDRVALVDRDGSLTYRELNDRANRLAHYLRARGIGSETLTGLCIERSTHAIVALLAILKAGGAYVYLDPHYPTARLAEMVQDSGLALIVSNAELRQRIFGGTGTFVCVDEEAAAISSESTHNPDSGVTLDSAAYVIYTSGSTGAPKGAVEVHRSMTSRLISAPLADILPSDICCLNSSLSFGISASRLFFPLVNGAPVVVLGEDEVRDVRAFVRALEFHSVTSVFMVPALLAEVLDLRDRGLAGLDRIRNVTVSGGVLTPHQAERFFRLLPQALLINIYGSTEVGTTAAMKVSHANQRYSNSIGRPVANTRIHILDERMVPADVGVTGEIYVSAPHLARGYLHRPDLTARTFLPDPFVEGGRMCRTGDLGRYREDGEIEFIGRFDQQVKIRGYRIELAEVEEVLARHVSVSQAAVLAMGPAESKSLVAFVVAKQKGPAAERSLRAFLAECLPPYMVPARFVFLDRMPLTAAGKLDRSVLAEWKHPSFHQSAAEMGAASENEQILMDVWRELLDGAPVGVHDNFVELGGDSLRATRILAAVSERFGVELSIRFVFEGTLQEMSTEIARQQAQGQG